MTALATKKMTVTEYIAWAETQPDRPRYELINGVPVAQSPEPVRHATTKHRIASALDSAIKHAGLECHMLPDGMTVAIHEHTSYEPDALVYCGQELPGDDVIVPEPVIVVELLSPSTKHIDSGSKFHNYFSLPSIRHYLVIDPENATIMHHRCDDGGQIVTDVIKEGSFELTPPGLTLSHGGIF